MSEASAITSNEIKHRHQLEAQQVQKPFAKALRQMIDTGYIFKQNPDLELFEFTSTANTNAGNAIRGKYQKDMGYQKGWYDLTFIIKKKDSEAFPALIECKYKDWATSGSDSQKDFGKRLDQASVRRAIITSPSQGYEALRNWGVIV